MRLLTEFLEGMAMKEMASGDTRCGLLARSADLLERGLMGPSGPRCGAGCAARHILLARDVLPSRAGLLAKHHGSHDDASDAGTFAQSSTPDSCPTPPARRCTV